jgi:hypothetical protein
MSTRRNFLLIAAVATAAAMPASAQTLTAGPIGGEAHGAASIPDFTGAWTHWAIPWFEPPASAPGPITNLSRWPEQRPQTLGGSAALPVSTVGVSNYAIWGRRGKGAGIGCLLCLALASPWRGYGARALGRPKRKRRVSATGPSLLGTDTDSNSADRAGEEAIENGQRVVRPRHRQRYKNQNYQHCGCVLLIIRFPRPVIVIATRA